MACVTSQGLCNVKQDGMFKCECTEISYGRISVDCSDNSFLKIPTKGFPRETTKLTLNNNYISRIESNTFSDLVNLNYLDLSNNDIYWIANTAFYFMPHLNNINLHGVKLQCDCETKYLRDWSLTTGVSLSGAKCSNFIKDRELVDVPDDQFGQCNNPVQQSCTLCSVASALGECEEGGYMLECQHQESCQLTSYIISGQQVVKSHCQKTSECIKELILNPVRCANASPNQRCTFCCRGPNCNRLINTQGYTYQTSMIIGFTLKEMFDDNLLQIESKEYQKLSVYVLQEIERVMSAVTDAHIQLLHFRPSPINQTAVTFHSTSVWDLERSTSYIQEQIYRILKNAIKQLDLDIPLVDESLMVYARGYCKGEITTTKEGSFKWPDTPLGAEVDISCPYPRHIDGQAKRSCITVWHEEDLVELTTWSDPDLMGCAVPSNVTDQLQVLVNTPITKGKLT
ncbi:hypothetical protein LSH36_221g01006 [Paralvinella palmiformis]|uniref:G-protein coupled receptors family 2 profile 1 domain-containing protein n=1 Tax=Paralvinella palmiformis TaxID=53620 RepID=A0AAD9JNQ4_9ANNE|nr:hypothetical protein LSH36_221g01006 [Paralvinella palmiformis]